MALHDEYAAILRDHPPRVDTASFAAEAGAVVHAGAAAAVQAVLSREIGAGRELGVQVYAYRHGRLQLAVVAGVHRPMGGGGWASVEPETLFMAFSVAKGVAATGMALLAGGASWWYCHGCWMTPPSKLTLVCVPQEGKGIQQTDCV